MSNVRVVRWLNALVIAGCTLACACSAPVDGEPRITLEVVPVAAAGGPDRLAEIAGTVTGARPGQKIVLFTHSSTWYVQPFKSDPYTAIKPDGHWTSPTHLGAEYAALLVNPGYRAPATVGSLPEVGGDVVAVASIPGRAAPPGVVTPQAKLLTFGGYEWEIRQTPSDRGGPNPYHGDNAWVDADGALHLKLAKRHDVWTSAEVRLARSLGYGTYTFSIRDTSHLDPAAVVSMVTCDEGASVSNYRELAVELGRFGNEQAADAQYVVQPHYIAENVFRFKAPARRLTHSMTWQPGRALFSTTAGERVVAQHEFVTGIPSPGRERAYLNAYYYRNAPLPPRREVEVVIDRFQYLP